MNAAFVSLVLLAQPRPPQTVGDNEGYVPSKMSPADICRKADLSSSTLRDAEATTVQILELPVGNGQARGKIHFRDRSHVFTQYGLVQALKDVDTAFAVRNGNVVSLYGPPQKWTGKLPNVKGLTGGAASADYWLSSAGLPIYANIVAGQSSFSQLLAGMRRDRSIILAVHERKITIQGNTYQTVRLTATRVKPALKLALTFERRTLVPTTMLAEGKVKDGKARVIWSATWKGPSKFPDSDFKLR